MSGSGPCVVCSRGRGYGIVATKLVLPALAAVGHVDVCIADRRIFAVQIAGTLLMMSASACWVATAAVGSSQRMDTGKNEAVFARGVSTELRSHRLHASDVETIDNRRWAYLRA